MLIYNVRADAVLTVNIMRQGASFWLCVDAGQEFFTDLRQIQGKSVGWKEKKGDMSMKGMMGIIWKVR